MLKPTYQPNNILLYIPGALLILFSFSACSDTDEGKKAPSENQELIMENEPFTTSVLSVDADTSGLIKKTGTLNYSGNEPFARPAIFVSGSESYLLQGDSLFMEQTFDLLNGQTATLYGKTDTTGSIITFKVHYYSSRN